MATPVATQNNSRIMTLEPLRMLSTTEKVKLLTHIVQLTEKVFEHTATKMPSVMRAVKNITCIATMGTSLFDLCVIITTLSMGQVWR